ncbi:hypothetical protein AB685_22235, partial [Bacillus sp. LL01]|uniref:SLC13 family permease n=1 Tax=Bacillus sp. LL01 TaxID=1665556 RepID=UPI00064D3131
MAEIQHTVKKETWKYLVAGLFMVGIIMTPLVQISEEIDSKIITTGAIFILAIFLWVSRVIPASLTAICVIVLFAIFDVITFEQAASGLGNEIIWLVLSVLFMGLAVEKTNLDKRIAYSILSFSKGSVRVILLNLIVSAFLLTFLIPNAVGRLAVLMPIGKGIIDSMQKEAGENIGKSIMLIVTYAPYVTTVALLTGASGSIYATGLFESMVGYSWGYLNWMVVMIPLVLFVLLALWIIL